MVSSVTASSPVDEILNRLAGRWSDCASIVSVRVENSSVGLPSVVLSYTTVRPSGAKRAWRIKAERKLICVNAAWLTAGRCNAQAAIAPIARAASSIAGIRKWERFRFASFSGRNPPVEVPALLSESRAKARSLAD
jgi:hypothetical protein